MKILVIGGTGPTGIPIVRRLVENGHDLTILHRGTHERPGLVVTCDTSTAEACAAALAACRASRRDGPQSARRGPHRAVPTRAETVPDRGEP